MKRFRLIFILVFSITLSFVGGSILGSSVNATNECDSEASQVVEDNGNLLSFLFSENTASAACQSLRYMGGKWSNYGNIRYYNGLDNSRISGEFEDAITHYNNVAPKVLFNDLSFTEYSSWNGIGIIARDGKYTSSDWTGKAEGSYIDGEFPDSYYSQINIIFNEQNSNGINVGNYDLWTLQGVAAHEIGHSVGLGHSTLTSRLMYCYDSRDVNTLSDTDKNIIEEIY